MLGEPAIENRNANAIIDGDVFGSDRYEPFVNAIPIGKYASELLENINQHRMGGLSNSVRLRL